MEDKKENGIILFDTTQAAIKAEKALDRSGIKIKIIPVPRHISTNCGISIMFDMNDIDRVRLVLKDNNVPISDISSFNP